MRKWIMKSVLVISAIGFLSSGSMLSMNKVSAATRKSYKMSKGIAANMTGSFKNVELEESKDGTSTISWSKVKGASKYQIYVSNKKNGSYKYLGETKGREFEVKTSNKKQFFKICACVNINVNQCGSFCVTICTQIIEKPAESEKPEVPEIPEVPSIPEIPSEPEVPEVPSEPEEPSEPEIEEGATQDAYVRQVFELVNEERQRAGLSSLKLTNALNQAAHQRAVETVSLFSHTRPNGSSFSSVLREFGINYNAAGENIAYGQRSPEEVMQGWMNSSGHRANILGSQFGKIGIGCYERNGVLYWSQLFTD